MGDSGTEVAVVETAATLAAVAAAAAMAAAVAAAVSVGASRTTYMLTDVARERSRAVRTSERGRSISLILLLYVR